MNFLANQPELLTIFVLKMNLNAAIFKEEENAYTQEDGVPLDTSNELNLIKWGKGSQVVLHRKNFKVQKDLLYLKTLQRPQINKILNKKFLPELKVGVPPNKTLTLWIRNIGQYAALGRQLN